MGRVGCTNTLRPTIATSKKKRGNKKIKGTSTSTSASFLLPVVVGVQTRVQGRRVGERRHARWEERLLELR